MSASTIGSRVKPAGGPHPTPVLLRLSALLSAVAGFALGFVLLAAIALGQAGALPFAALAQAHGQVQALGFVGLFVLGTAAQLLPGFLATPLVHRHAIVGGGFLLALGLGARVVGQPLALGLPRDLLLAVSALSETSGIVLCLFGFADLPRRSIQPPDLWRSLTLLGFGFLVLSLALNLVAVGTLIAGEAVVSTPLDAALVEAELGGFATLLTFAVARKILPRFLLLPSPHDRWIKLGVFVYGLGVALLVGAGLIGAIDPRAWSAEVRSGGAWLKLLGTAFVLGGLKLFGAPTRPSGAPEVTESARRWLRLAFGWLVVASALAALAETRALLVGSTPDYFALSAARHALGQGFLLTLIVALGARILPGFSAWAIVHPREVELLVSSVSLGAALRVAGELGLSFHLVAGPALAAAGGAVGLGGFLGFAVTLTVTVGRPPGRRSQPPPR